MTPASIRYLLVLDDLCREGRGVRSVEIAARMNRTDAVPRSIPMSFASEHIMLPLSFSFVFRRKYPHFISLAFLL